MKCRSVLVIDDDQDIKEGIQEALVTYGYVVHTAANGQEALDYLNNLSKDALPGCIILDLAMPVMNGPEFLKHIETSYSDDFGDIPIIVASANLSHVEASSISKATLKMKKPFELDVLYKAIEHHCGQPAS